MARMSRAESQAQTRSQLVTTARQMFFDDGYHPTSLEKVADAAGYSKGAVYSNFRNKDELCICGARRSPGRALRRDSRLWPRGHLDRVEALQGWAERVIGDPAWTPLEVEFASHARTEPTGPRSGLAGRLDSIIEMLTEAGDLNPPRSSTSAAQPRSSHRACSRSGSDSA